MVYASFFAGVIVGVSGALLARGRQRLLPARARVVHLAHTLAAYRHRGNFSAKLRAGLGTVRAQLHPLLPYLRRCYAKLPARVHRYERLLIGAAAYGCVLLLVVHIARSAINRKTHSRPIAIAHMEPAKVADDTYFIPRPETPEDAALLSPAASNAAINSPISAPVAVDSTLAAAPAEPAPVAADKGADTTPPRSAIHHVVTPAPVVAQAAPADQHAQDPEPTQRKSVLAKPRALRAAAQSTPRKTAIDNPLRIRSSATQRATASTQTLAGITVYSDLR